MNGKKTLVPALAASALFVGIAGLVVSADPAAEKQVPTPPEMQLPEGWTEADMQACMLAGIPGDMQKHLVEGVGVWQGKTTMWMFPGADPVQSECTSTVTSMMDGRYVKCEMAGDTPGMGPYAGMGIYGFDNVSQRFVCTWLDNWSTGLMNGVGDLSEDGKTLSWKFTFNCPVTKKPAIMRETETITGPNTKTLDIESTDPKTGKEFKMMHIEFTRE